MRNYSVKNIPTLIRRSVIKSLAVGVFVAFLLSFVYAFVYHYEQKYLHIQQFAELIADSASTAEGASLTAYQARMLLNDDATLLNIMFYSTDQPIFQNNQTGIKKTSNIWYDAFFADTVNFDHAVTNSYLIDNNVQSDKQLAEYHALVGYIHVTLDVHKLRVAWLRQNIFLWLLTVTIALVVILIITRKLSWPSRDITELAKVCHIVLNDPDLGQLPVIHQHFKFEELILIRQAFITLFSRLKSAQQKLDELAIFEQQLHNKDVSLDMQRHNFQSMITHELKTSLNAISGGLQLLDSHYLSDEQKDTIAIIHKGSQHLDATLEQIIQLNKIEKGQMGITQSLFSPLQLIADLFAEFEIEAKQKNLELNYYVHHIDYTLEGDVEKIKHILSALVDNAIKFTELGQVSIESQLTHFNESIHWQIKVTDTGIGIDAKYMDDIFTPFFQVDPSYTRKFEGAGVGLPVVKQIIQLLGASIEVNSKLGVGSDFTVLIPLRNTYQAQHKYSLVERKIIYYHYSEVGFIVAELQRLGADVSCHQHERSVLEMLSTTKVDMVMIAEDIPPEKAEQLARYIRKQEDIHRVMVSYWYPKHQEHTLDYFEHGLKAAGVDFCHSAPRESKLLYKLLKQWLI